MIHRFTSDGRRKSSSNNALSHNGKTKESSPSSPLQRNRRRTFLSLIMMGSLLLLYFGSVFLLSNNDSLSQIRISETLVSSGMGSGWKVSSSANTAYVQQKQQAVVLYMGGGLSSEEEKSATNSLRSLVDQFGSQSLQWEVVRMDVKPALNSTRQRLSCVWISKTDTPRSTGDNIMASGCIRMVPLMEQSSDDPSKTAALDWKLDALTRPGRSNNSTICLARQVGPRGDFWNRVVNFERVGLWVQSASIRSHIWNLALVHPESSKSILALQPRLADTVHKLTKEKLPTLMGGQNASDIAVNKPVDERRPVPYFRDLLTSVFAFVMWEPESLDTSTLQNPMPQGKRQQQSQKRKQSLGARRFLFWKHLQEIILTGAIPIVIMVGDSSSRTQIECNEELFFHSTSPILTVSNQEDQIRALIGTLINESPTKWNERQLELREWYQGVMLKRALQIENWILETAPSARISSPEMRSQWALQHWKSSVPAFLQQRKYDPKPLCLTPPFYGRTNNKVIEIGKLLKLSYQEGKHRALALDRRWTNWYRQFFDERPDVLLDFYPHGECEKVFTARESFEIPDWDLSYLIHLLPRHDFRERAEKIMNTWQHGTNYISVHRRDLEGSCHVHAKCSDVELETSTCLQKRDPSEVCSVELRLQACDYEYSTVPNPEGLPIVLFTDGQVAAKDATFPHTFNTTDFFVEMWLMVKSKTHWGNPRSTVDAVVQSWREGQGMEPKACYPT